MPSTAAGMSSIPTKNELDIRFVTTSDGSFPKSGSVRKQIRQHAMNRVAAERRQRGDYGQINVGQYPEEIFGQAKLFNAIPRPMQAMGYERMRINYNFDVLDLSALTSFHIGQIASQTLKAKPENLLGLLKCRQWSYFSYVPGQYGHSKCLDDAIHCIAVRVRQYVGDPGGTPDQYAIQFYQVALRSLQDSLDDPHKPLDPDVLCATEILAIYEVLFAISTN